MWNNPLYVVAFILGFVIIIFSLLMFLFPKKNSHLFIKFLFDITYIVQMLFIFFATGTYGVFAGIASNSVGAIRDVAFIKNDNKTYRTYWNMGLCALMIILLHFSYTGTISFLPVFGTLINTTALAFKSKKNTCMLTVVGQLFFITYYALLLKESSLLTVLNVISASMLFISAIIGLVIAISKNRLTRKENF